MAKALLPYLALAAAALSPARGLLDGFPSLEPAEARASPAALHAAKTSLQGLAEAKVHAAKGHGAADAAFHGGWQDAHATLVLPTSATYAPASHFVAPPSMAATLALLAENFDNLDMVCLNIVDDLAHEGGNFLSRTLAKIHLAVRRKDFGIINIAM